MNTKEIFLKCCQAHQWTPLHINSDGNKGLNSKSIDEELKEALERGQLELCLDLIELSKTMNLQSATQLKIKEITLQKRLQQDSTKREISEETDNSLDGLIEQLLEICREENWHANYIISIPETNNRWEVEQAILKEAEAARNADRADTSLNLINTTLKLGFNSLWLHHLKGRALHKTGKIEEAIEIWEKLAKHEIEGFSQNILLALKTAKTEQALSYARQQEASGQLDSAIETLTSTLLKDPDQKEIETDLKSMLQKRRRINQPDTQDMQPSEHMAELDINEQFLNLADKLLKKGTLKIQ